MRMNKTTELTSVLQAWSLAHPYYTYCVIIVQPDDVIGSWDLSRWSSSAARNFHWPLLRGRRWRWSIPVGRGGAVEPKKWFVLTKRRSSLNAGARSYMRPKTSAGAWCLSSGTTTHRFTCFQTRLKSRKVKEHISSALIMTSLVSQLLKLRSLFLSLFESTLLSHSPRLRFNAQIDTSFWLQ